MSFYQTSRTVRALFTRATQWRRSVHSSMKLKSIADGGQGTHKPTPFEEKVLVWTKAYKSVGDVPERVTKSQMKKAFDKFRVKVSIGMIAITFVFAAIMAMIGRKERLDGKTMTHISIQKRDE